jgi:hypothetical protein
MKPKCPALRAEVTKSLLITTVSTCSLRLSPAIYLLLLAVRFLFLIPELRAQGNIPCDGSFYFTRQIGSSTRISAVNVDVSGTVTVSDKLSLNPNALTNSTVYYNGYVFSQRWNQDNFILARIANYDAQNNFTTKLVNGIPKANLNNAGIDKDGVMYLLSTDATPILYKIDLKEWRPGGPAELTATSVPCSMDPGTRLWGDIAFDPITNKAYAWYHPRDTPSAGQAKRGLYEIRNINSASPSIVKVGKESNYTMGTLFFNERGQLFSYGVASDPGGDHVNFYYIDKVENDVTPIGSSQASPQSDGCECSYRLSLTLTAGDNDGVVLIPNCTRPSNFKINFVANNTAVGGFSGITFEFPLDPRLSFAKSQAEIETYLQTIFGPDVEVTISDSDGGTNNLISATGLAVPGTTSNGGAPISLPFALEVAVEADENSFTNGEKIDFQASFGGISDFYGGIETSSDPLSLFGKVASRRTFNKTNALCITPVPSLPVTLLTFNARSEDNGIVSLNWKTSSEVNASNFLIERSTDSRHWTLIKDVRAMGTTNAETEYNEYDENPASGRNYYRLKMIDLDGSFSYSRILSVHLNGDSTNVALYPNPSAGKFFVKDIDSKSILLLSITDMKGQEVFQQLMPTEQGVDVSGLSNGVYFVKLWKNNGEILIRKLLISR